MAQLPKQIKDENKEIVSIEICETEFYQYVELQRMKGGFELFEQIHLENFLKKVFKKRVEKFIDFTYERKNGHYILECSVIKFDVEKLAEQYFAWEKIYFYSQMEKEKDTAAIALKQMQRFIKLISQYKI